MNSPLARIKTWTDKVGQVTRMPVMAAPRGGHGGGAWSLPFAEPMMFQPQDGAVDTRTRLATIKSHQHSDLLQEPEDARLTGGTRSLNRRLLGLNIAAKIRKTPEMIKGPLAGSQVA